MAWPNCACVDFCEPPYHLVFSDFWSCSGPECDHEVSIHVRWISTVLRRWNGFLHCEDKEQAVSAATNNSSNSNSYSNSYSYSNTKQQLTDLTNEPIRTRPQQPLLSSPLLTTKSNQTKPSEDNKRQDKTPQDKSVKPSPAKRLSFFYCHRTCRSL